LNILQNFIKNIADIDDVSSQKLVDLATIVNFKKMMLLLELETYKVIFTYLEVVL
jgi:hypothetical protein